MVCTLLSAIWFHVVYVKGLRFMFMSGFISHLIKGTYLKTIKNKDATDLAGKPQGVERFPEAVRLWGDVHEHQAGMSTTEIQSA